MEELQLTLTPTRVDQRSQGIMFSNWRVGQTLSALVSDRMPNGGLLLSVGSQSFVTSRDIPVQPGSRIQLEVQQTEPKLLLRLISHPRSTEVHPTPENFVNGTSPYAAKAGARSLIGVFNNIMQARFPGLAASVPEMKALLVNNFLTPNYIDAKAIQAALVSSGIFTEALWLSNRPYLGAKSTKTILMDLRRRVVSAIESLTLSPTERAALARLLGSIDSYITSITYQQMASLPEDSERPRWLATLPLQLGDEICEIDVEIERRPRQKSDDIDQWRFKFSITLESLGPVTVFVELQNNRLRIDFQVSASVSGPLNESLPLLRNGLIASGLQPDQLSSSTFKTKPEGEDETSQNSLNIFI